MTHFAVFAPPYFSHLRAVEALAEPLAARGHRLTLIHMADVGAHIRSPALGFRAAGAASHPPGSLAALLRHVAAPGAFGLPRVIGGVARATDMLCREAPAALREIGAEAVIADQMEAAGGLVAQALGLPYVSVVNALPINREPAVPPPFLAWSYDDSDRGLRRNRGGERVSDLLMAPVHRTIARHAAAFGLPPRRTIADCLSPYAELSQTVAGFDFPRRRLPPTFHHVGPLRPPPAAEPPLDLPIDPARPFVFASLGTLQGGRFDIFRAIAKACRALGVQVLIAHCGGLTAAQATELAELGAAWVTDFAPQRAALARADAVITHAGPNTVLDALAAGVPMLAIPLAFDQPGTAARIVHAGVGERVSPRLLTAGRVRRALVRVLDGDRYRPRLAALQREIAAAGGAPRAVEIVERVAATRAPVTAAALAA